MAFNNVVFSHRKEAMYLSTLPDELLENVLHRVPSRSVLSVARSLQTSNPEFQERVFGIATPILQSTIGPITIDTLRSLPHINQVPFPIYVSTGTFLQDLHNVCQQIRGNLDIIENNFQISLNIIPQPLFIKDAIEVLVVRGLLYPQSTISMSVSSSHLSYDGRSRMLQIMMATSSLYSEEKLILEEWENVPLDHLGKLPISRLQVGGPPRESTPGLEAKIRDLINNSKNGKIGTLILDDDYFFPINILKNNKSIHTLEIGDNGNLGIATFSEPVSEKEGNVVTSITGKGLLGTEHFQQILLNFPHLNSVIFRAIGNNKEEVRRMKKLQGRYPTIHMHLNFE